MLKKIKIIAVFFSLLLSGQAEIAAQSGVRGSEALEDLFTVRSIQVDETASNATVARQTGILKAEIYAFDRLMRKILSKDGLERLPPLTTREKQGMIRGMEMVWEKNSNRRYLAEVNISFEPSKITEWLAIAEIPHVVGAGNGLLILHAHQKGSLQYLWQMDPDMVAAWTATDYKNRLRHYQFPKGDIADRMQISYTQIERQQSMIADQMAKGYQLDGALLIETDYDPLGTGVLSYRYYLTTIGHEGSGRLVKTGDQTVTDLYAMALEDILSAVDELWRSQLLVDSDVAGTIALLVPSKDMESYNRITKAVASISVITEWKVEEIAIPLSKARLSFVGRQDQLEIALRLAGVEIVAYGDEQLLSFIEE